MTPQVSAEDYPDPHERGIAQAMLDMRTGIDDVKETIAKLETERPYATDETGRLYLSRLNEARATLARLEASVADF